MDAIELVAQDDDNVMALFQRFEEAGEKAYASKKKLATKICLEPAKHAIAKEQLF